MATPIPFFFDRNNNNGKDNNHKSGKGGDSNSGGRDEEREKSNATVTASSSNQIHKTPLRSAKLTSKLILPKSLPARGTYDGILHSSPQGSPYQQQQQHSHSTVSHHRTRSTASILITNIPTIRLIPSTLRGRGPPTHLIPDASTATAVLSPRFNIAARLSSRRWRRKWPHGAHHPHHAQPICSSEVQQQQQQACPPKTSLDDGLFGR